MQKVKIDKIIVNKRKRTTKDIKELAESIKEIGLLNPITLNKDLVLIAGFHRLQACKQLEWKEVPAIIINAENLTAELAEIDENLVRIYLTALENAEQLKRRKEIYELLHSKSKPENIKAQNLPKRKDFVSEKSKTFVEDAAQKMGKSTRSIQQDIQIASNIPEEIKQKIKGSELENKKSELLEIAKQKPEKQKEIVEKIKSGKAKNVKSAIYQNLQNETKSEEKQEEILISIEVYEKVKFALDEAEYERDLLKKENQELKAKIQEFEKQLSQEKKGEMKNEISKYDKNERITAVLETNLADFIVDKKRHSITFEGKEYPFPSDFVINNQSSINLVLVAKNYYQNELKNKKNC